MPGHIVTFSNTAHHDIHERFSDTQKDAVEFAERILKMYRYVWLSELGEYKTKAGRWIRDRVYYWWSPAVGETEWGECPDAGRGRPAGRKYLTAYRPLLYKSKKLAHLNVRATPTDRTAAAPSNQTKRVLIITDHEKGLALLARGLSSADRPKTSVP
jgi:hypothetical protein